MGESKPVDRDGKYVYVRVGGAVLLISLFNWSYMLEQETQWLVVVAGV